MEPAFKVLNQHNYLDYVKNKHCLILFFKNQCPNCKVLMKVMEKCASSHPDMLMAEVDSEGSSELLEELGISRVPTVLVYKNGEVSARKAGVMKPAEMVSLYYDARRYP